MHTSAPGRICIFGEHQDYLGHPVIAGAIDLFFYFKGDKRSDRRFIFHKPDLNETEAFEYPAEGLIPYEKKRDYFRSSLNVLKKKGFDIPHGAEVEIWSQIPIGAGASSSSVMLVAWLRFLTELFQLKRFQDPILIAEMAFLAEVAEFQEPGGKMDHYTSSLGGIQFLDFENKKCIKLRDKMTGFVLINSMEKKDTLGVLKKIKSGELEALSRIKDRYKGKSLLEFQERDLDFLPSDIKPYGIAAVLNYQMTWKGKGLFEHHSFDEPEFGRLLNCQHRILHECFQNTTPKINRIMEVAMENGALGGKMNGSGGGGTMFVYAPGKEEFIMDKLISFEAKAFKVAIV